MLTSGFDGVRMTASASRMASMTPGAGAALVAPSKMISQAWPSVRRWTKYSWKSSTPSSVRILVRSRSLVTGVMRAGTSRALAISAVASASVRPRRMRSVRVMQVARSRSPRRNQVS